MSPGIAGTRCAGALRRPPSPGRACRPARRRRGSSLRARAARCRLRWAALRAPGGRCQARSLRPGSGSAGGGPSASAGSRRRGTRGSPRTAPARSAARSRSTDLLEQMADLVLDLRAETSERCELHASVEAAQMPLCLREAADCPGDVPRELPVVELLRTDVSPRQLVVALDERGRIADAAEALLDGTETPRAHHPEREVAHRIVEMDELPVEHADETLRPDDDVADAVVAVIHDRRTHRWPVLAQPPQPELDRRMRLADLVELRDHAVDARLRQERQRVARDRVDLRELLRELDGQQLARTCELLLAHDPPADRVALEPRHCECLP